METVAREIASGCWQGWEPLTGATATPSLRSAQARPRGAQPLALTYCAHTESSWGGGGCNGNALCQGSAPHMLGAVVRATTCASLGLSFPFWALSVGPTPTFVDDDVLHNNIHLIGSAHFVGLYSCSESWSYNIPCLRKNCGWGYSGEPKVTPGAGAGASVLWEDATSEDAVSSPEGAVRGADGAAFPTSPRRGN